MHNAVVWKYKVDPSKIINGSIIIDIPRYSQFMSVSTENNQLLMFFSVYPDLEKERRKVYIIGTGQFIPEEAGDSIGTVMLPWKDGLSSYHVFDWRL